MCRTNTRVLRSSTQLKPKNIFFFFLPFQNNEHLIYPFLTLDALLIPPEAPLQTKHEWLDRG